MDNKLKIREVCGDYALDIPFADGSVNTIYFNSKRNAETVKHIIEIDDSNPKNDLYDYCPKNVRSSQARQSGIDVYHWWMEDNVLPGQLTIDGENDW